jgi:chorismate mutase
MISKILKENNIVPNQEEVKGGNQLQVIVKTVMKLQSTLIANNGMNKQDIKSIIMSMKPEIENSFDASMQQEVSKLLENLGGMTDMIESNFSQIKQTLQEFKDDIITSVT